MGKPVSSSSTGRSDSATTCPSTRTSTWRSAWLMVMVCPEVMGGTTSGALPTFRGSESPERCGGLRKQLVEAMRTAVEWYHQRLLTSDDARAARDYLRARGLAGDIARQFKLGWAPDDWDAMSRDVRAARRCPARDRPGVHQQVGSFAGLVPRAGDVPDHVGERRSGGVRRADPSRVAGSGEVQELGRDVYLCQVEDSVRITCGKGRDRDGRSGDRVRGLHRCHRLPSRRCEARRRHLRYQR